MARLKIPALLGLQLFAAGISSQITFSNKSSLLGPDHFSGVAMAVVDMNGDGQDDIVRLDQGLSLNIQYQTAPDQPFADKQIGYLPDTQYRQWGICTADVDNNGFADILTGGFYDGIKIIQANADGSDFHITNYLDSLTFVQGVNFADINNDGWLDAFVCHDDGKSRIWGNNGDGSFTYQPTWIDLATVPFSDNSGNYGSVWSDVDNDGDVDLYIAHCRQNVNDPTDPRRINQLFLNNGDGTYTQDITNESGLRIGAQSWTADFGDIDNDGDFDCFITNHDVSSQVLENDGHGHFTDITATSGLLNNIIGLPIQGVFRDFDNDGFVDILVVGEHIQYLFINSGNKSFYPLPTLFNFNKMESFALGDLNSDGFQDIYGGYANVYNNPSFISDVLWMNDGNSNHFFGMKLRGVQSNRGAVGAKVQLYSSLGIQTREVRSGESYGISNSLNIHFGLGQVENIDSVVVNWPSGHRDVLYNPGRDQYINFIEGGCALTAVNLETIGAINICSGQSTDIKAPDGFAYLWNTGDTTQVITVSSTGEYKVTVTSPLGCSAVSEIVNITVDPIETPVISLSGESVICAGNPIVLTSTPAASYLWSNGATTQSITVSDGGNYSVKTQGLCASFNSELVTITALVSPLPTVTNDAVFVDSVANLAATGSLVNWYSAQDSPVPFFTGNSYTTPPLTLTTTYWVSNTTVFGIPNQHVGMTNHQGGSTSDNTYNGGLIFNCLTPFKLKSTKVYTSKSGDRKIKLISQSGFVIQEKTVNIPVGTTVIDLGFDVPVGNGHLLTTDADVNQAVLGTDGPQLRRSNVGVVFPYEVPDIVSIYTSTLDQTRYYYFFDWEIDLGSHTCESPRVPVTADVSVSATNSPVWATDLQIFPNPTTGRLQVSGKNFQGGSLLATVKNAQGISLQSSTFEAASGTFDYQTDLSALPKGVYWLELAGKDGVVRRMVVVQ